SSAHLLICSTLHLLRLLRLFRLDDDNCWWLRPLRPGGGGTSFRPATSTPLPTPTPAPPPTPTPVAPRSVFISSSGDCRSDGGGNSGAKGLCARTDRSSAWKGLVEPSENHSPSPSGCQPPPSMPKNPWSSMKVGKEPAGSRSPPPPPPPNPPPPPPPRPTLPKPKSRSSPWPSRSLSLSKDRGAWVSSGACAVQSTCMGAWPNMCAGGPDRRGGATARSRSTGGGGAIKGAGFCSGTPSLLGAIVSLLGEAHPRAHTPFSYPPVEN
ncbi:hypothetical protein B484DRAFT_287653, partial [Ochromonadaceae sp. CCMP2298]